MTKKTMIFALLGLSALSLAHTGRADPLHPLPLPEAGPPSIAQAQEDVVAQSGWLSIIIGDPSESGSKQKTPHIKYLLTDAQGLTTEVYISPKLLQSVGGNEKLRNKQVKVWGKKNKASGHIVVTHVEPTAAAAGGSGVAAPEPALSAPVSKPWANILCRFGDTPKVTPHDALWFSTLMGNSYPGMDHFWRENSYDQMNLIGTQVYGWYNLPSPKSAYFTDTNGNGYIDYFEINHGKLANDCAAVADAFVYFPDFIGVNFMFNEDLYGAAWGGGVSLTTDGLPPRGYSATWMPPWGYENQYVMAQEMGHGYGLPHSSGAYGGTYDSQWDPMSGGGACVVRHPQYGCLGDNTISYHKDRLGWIAPERKYIAQPGTTATLHIERLAQPASTTGYLMAQIPLGTTGTRFYTVEARRKVGYDVEIPGEAIIIHNVDTSRGDRLAQVVDSDTTNTNPNDAGAMWTVGETFTDPVRGVTITVQNMTSTGYDVTISNIPPPAPDLLVSSVTASPTTTAAGGTINVSFRVTNQGPASTGQGFIAKVYLNAPWLISKTLLASVNIPALAAGGIYDASISASSDSTLGASRLYQIEVVADEADQIWETNEDNNRAFSANISITSGADLTVSTVTGPSTARPGENLKSSPISVTVCNVGSGASLGYWRLLYLSTDAVITSADRQIGIIYFDAQHAGGNTCLSENTITNPYSGADIPSDLTPGTYYLGAIADGGDHVPESNETNNGKAGPQILISSNVDLVVSSITAPTTPVAAGSTVNIPFQVKNQGTSSTVQGFSANVYLTWYTGGGGRVLLGSVTQAEAIPAGGTANLSINPTLPNNLGASRNYTIEVVVDEANQIVESGESGETNNSSWSPAFTITTGANLTITAVSAPSVVRPGDNPLSISVTVCNNGSGAAGFFGIAGHLSPDAVIDDSDAEIYWISQNSLAANTCVTASPAATYPGKIPATQASGVYNLLSRVDDFDKVPETNESDNIWTSSMQVVNQAPIANPGPSQNVNQGTVATLAGSGSDADGTVVSYEWTQVVYTGDPVVSLNGGNTATATFTAPLITGSTYMLEFQLKVTDNNGATGIAKTWVYVKNGPDLIVTTQTATLVATTKRGVTTYKLSIGNQVKNQGNVSAGSSSVGYYLSTDAAYSTNDIFVCARSVTSLAAGVSNPTTGVTTSSCSVPSTALKNTPYYVIGVADYLKAVAESTENNNAKSTAATITVP